MNFNSKRIVLESGVIEVIFFATWKKITISYKLKKLTPEIFNTINKEIVNLSSSFKDYEITIIKVK